MKNGLMSGTGAAAALLCALCTPVAQAQSGIAVGLQSTMAATGPSVRYSLSEELSVQAVLGALGSTTNVAGRGLLYVRNTEALDLYYYGQVGFWRFSGGSISSDSGIGLGAGVGLDYDLQEAIDNILPLTLSVEAGIGYVAWDDYSGFDLVTLGLGLHYRLGDR